MWPTCLATCDDTSRARFGPSRQTFFVSSAGKPVTAAAVGVMFNRIWDQAGLPRPTGGSGPGPTISGTTSPTPTSNGGWRGGIDVAAMLPYLSTYMGHATVESHLLLHPHLARLHGRLRAHHAGKPVGAAGGRIRMRHDPQTGAPDFFSFARDYLHTYMPTIRGLSPKTIEAYRISLECFLAFLAEPRTHRPRQGQLRPFRPAAPQSLDGLDRRRQALRHTRTITAAAQRHQGVPGLRSHEDITLVALSQAARSPQGHRPAPRKPIEYLTEAETRAVLSAFTGRTAKSRRNRMLLILLYDTAARVGEITA